MILFGDISKEELKSRKHWVIGVGVCLSILGFTAVSMPFMASIAIETLVGWLIMTVGIAQAINGYRASKNGEKVFFKFVWALLGIATGIILLAKPLDGVITLTMLLSVYFVMEGICKVIMSIQLRPLSGWGWMLVSGLMALVLSGLIWSNFFAAAWAIGLVVGINMLFTGSSFIVLGWRIGKD